ncbi:MAG TPA: glycoside hydrolase family 3 N-terminal domain-containing protein [Candidatus Acidoferrales bacterium]|nr:glycoside hydrolase family 3 N-terminal domain-containing protein [Candidatus Acidoferrales bacterium]
MTKLIPFYAFIAFLVYGCTAANHSTSRKSTTDKEQPSITSAATTHVGVSTDAYPVEHSENYKWNADENWVDGTLRSLTLREKVAQMIVPYSLSQYFSEDDPEYKDLVHMVRDEKVGGIVVSLGNIYEQAVLLNRLQKLADVPLLISSDYENGLGMRLTGGISFPSNMALGATRDSALVYEIGKAVGREARAVGVFQNYAPVSDVNDNPENPIINVRSYGENPELVAKLASAFIKGNQDGGVIATAKHFPGHGDTQVDSHLGLPVINYGFERLDTVELVPFRADIAAGVKSVMVAHIAFPKIETKQGIPGTLSPGITTGVLKDSLGFHGLVVTDAMTMKGVTSEFSGAEAAIRAVKAGADIVLMPPDNNVAIDAITKAVERGEINRSRIDSAVRKILMMKSELGLNGNRIVDLSNIPKVVGTEEHELLAEHAARRSITIVKNEGNVLPLQYEQPQRMVCLIVADNSDPNVARDFKQELLQRYENVSFLQIDPSSNELDFQNALSVVANSGLILIPTYVRWRSGSGTIDFTPPVQSFLQKVTNSRKPVVMVSFGNPYLLRSVPNVPAYVCAYGDMKVSVQAAVQTLFGEINVSGKLPVTISGVAKYGDGIDLPQTSLRFAAAQEAGFNSMKLAQLDSILNFWIADSAFPCAQLLVAKDGKIVFDKAFGTYDYSPLSRTIDLNTMFDLASLTKICATTFAAMKLYGEGKLDIEAPVAKYLPQFGQNGKEKITVRDLLVHDSGLPPDPPMFLWDTSVIPQEQMDRLLRDPRSFVEADSFGSNFNAAHEAMWDSLYATLLNYPTGTKMVYSDINFLVIGKIVEKITGMTLDKYVEENFYHPLGMVHTMFTPPASLAQICAPTEYDSAAGYLIQGVVHDENSRSLGGVTGHAGLFSTADDIAICLQLILNHGTYDGRRYLQDSVIALFTRKQSDLSTRALGWDTKAPAPHYSSSGHYFSPNSFGHTGFTGTSIWIDPVRNLFVVLFTNRVCPTRENEKIEKARPDIHDAVIKALMNDK